VAEAGQWRGGHVPGQAARKKRKRAAQTFADAAVSRSRPEVEPAGENHPTGKFRNLAPEILRRRGRENQNNVQAGLLDHGSSFPRLNFPSPRGKGGTCFRNTWPSRGAQDRRKGLKMKTRKTEAGGGRESRPAFLQIEGLYLCRPSSNTGTAVGIEKARRTSCLIGTREDW